MILKILRAIVKFLFPRLRVVAEHGIKEPSVFVCNHLGSFGPIAMMLYFPSAIRPWVSHRTMTKGLARQQIAADIFRKEAKVPLWVKKALGIILEGPAIWAMKLLNAIPVYFDAVNVADTFNESIRILNSGVNIAIFADKDKDHIDESVSGGIRSGCIYLAHLYGRSSKKSLLFYPVHVSRKNREIRIGEPVAYDRANTGRSEVRRVAEALEKSIQELGAAKKEDKKRFA